MAFFFTLIYESVVKFSPIVRFFERRLVAPLIAFLQQGLSPEKLSLCVALGVTLGTFPVLGSTTILCTVAAVALRLNMPAIQLINYFAYPLQLVLFIPFIRAGEFLFRQPPLPIDLVQIFSMLQADMFGAIQSLWWTNMRAIVAWSLAAPPAGFAIYFILRPIFIRLAPSRSAE